MNTTAEPVYTDPIVNDEQVRLCLVTSPNLVLIDIPLSGLWSVPVPRDKQWPFMACEAVRGLGLTDRCTRLGASHGPPRVTLPPRPTAWCLHWLCHSMIARYLRNPVQHTLWLPCKVYGPSLRYSIRFDVFVYNNSITGDVYLEGYLLSPA